MTENRQFPYPKLKRPMPRPPRKGWNYTIDGYTFHEKTEESLIEKVEKYLKVSGKEVDGIRLMIEQHICRENPHIALWGGLKPEENGA